VTEFNEYDDGFISLNDAELLAIGTREHRGTTVEFSDDGDNYVETWKPTPADGATPAITHPSYARATVIRKIDGDLVPTVVVVRWDEFVPDLGDPARDNWDRMPTVMLGKVAKVSAYRGAFRDVIGNRYERAEMDQARGRAARGVKAGPTPKEPTEDWVTLLIECKTPAEVRTLHARIIAAREITGDLDELIKDQLADLEQAEKKPARGGRK